MLSFFLLAFPAASSLSADTLGLKNGKLYTNVVVIVIAGQAAVIHQSGRVEFIKLRLIRRLSHGRTRWKRKVVVKTKVKTEVKTEVRTEVRTKVVRVLDRAAMERRVRRILEEKRKDRKRNERLAREKQREALLRSGLFPGLGQYHMGFRERAYAYMGVTGFFFLNYWRNRTLFRTAQDEYDGALGIPASPGNSTLAANYVLITTRRAALVRAETDLNNASWMLIGFWIWNVLEHLIFPVLGEDVPDGQSGPIKVSLTPDADGRANLRLGILLRF